jgi:hypothetical protein
MLLPWFHKFKCFCDFLFKLLSISHKLLFVLSVAQSPVMLLAADERVIDVFDHIAEHTHRIGCYLAKEYFLVAGLVDVDLFLVFR